MIGDEFSSYILQFCASGYLPKAINTTWVTLIPKKKGAEDISDFRPISMVGCVYKVIAKILSRRLKEVTPDLIGPTQTAFVCGRQILDGALIANELVNWLRKHKKEGILLKLDFRKAYDTMDLVSMDTVMKVMGFADKWRMWIKACVSTAHISILVNGEPCKPFKMGRGLRQGDPISPFLFVLMAEVLNKLLSKATAEGLFHGIHAGSSNVSVTHLQFVDDTLIFCEPKVEHLRNIKWVLYIFRKFSGLAVNYAKSGLIVLGKDESWAKTAEEEL